MHSFKRFSNSVSSLGTALLTVALSGLGACSQGGAPSNYDDVPALDLAKGAVDLGMADGGLPSEGECDSPCWLNPVPQGNSLEGVYRDPSGNGWAVGGSSIVRIEGDKLKLVRHPAWNRQTFLENIWGSGPSDIWVVGNAVLHFDGSTWTELGEYSLKGITDVWGTGPSDVWMVGISGQIHHYDGTSWTKVASGVTQALFHITGSSSRDIWAGGEYGLLLHWNGTAWQKVTSPTLDQIGSLSCASSTDCWMIPMRANDISGNTAFHWDGVRWTKQSSIPVGIFYAVIAVSANEVWLTGPNTYRFDGSTWTNTTTGRSYYSMQKISTSGTTEQLGVGSIGLISRWDGSTWRTLSSARATGVSGGRTSWHGGWTSPQGEFYFVGAGGEMGRYSAGKLEWLGTPAGTSTYFAMWGTSNKDIWIVGEYGRISHFDGTTWTQVASGVSESLRGVGGSGPSDVWAIGDKATILHYDGTSFTPSAGGPGISSVNALWVSSASEVWVGGTSGTLARWNGSAWTRWPKQFARDISAMWGSGPSDVWATGGTVVSEVMLLRYNGATWEAQPSPVGLEVPTALWGSGPLDLWMTGNYGGLLHWNGATWKKVPIGTNHTIKAIGRSGKSVFPVGEYGTVIQVKDGSNG